MKLKLEKKNDRDYEYEIYVDDKLVWHGLNPDKAYEKIAKENPGKKISVAWKPKGGILIGLHLGIRRKKALCSGQ